jgi:Replication initiation factor
VENHTATIVSVGVDWVTASAAEGPRAELLREYGLRVVGTEATKGDRMFEASRHGLSGWRTRHAVCIWNDQRTVVELHEHLSHEQWEDVLELADNCSRIDAEVTVRQEPFDRQLAIRQWSDSLGQRTEAGKEPYYDLYARRGRGNTLYIGSGASLYKARLYDKGRQSRLPVYADCWRYEVQARDERASQVVQHIQASSDARSDVAGIVRQHFLTRGVVPIFDAEPIADLPPLPRPPSDAERALGWIETAWRPTLGRLASWQAERDAWRVLGFAYDPRTGEKLREPLE